MSIDKLKVPNSLNGDKILINYIMKKFARVFASKFTEDQMLLTLCAIAISYFIGHVIFGLFNEIILPAITMGAILPVKIRLPKINVLFESEFNAMSKDIETLNPIYEQSKAFIAENYGYVKQINPISASLHALKFNTTVSKGTAYKMAYIACLNIALEHELTFEDQLNQLNALTGYKPKEMAKKVTVTKEIKGKKTPKLSLTKETPTSTLTEERIMNLIGETIARYMKK